MSSKTVTSATEPGTPGLQLPQQASGARPLSSSRLSGQNSFAICEADIEFFNIAPYLVAVEIKVTNDSDAPSAPDTLELLAAPFGVFVPWQPLASIALPALSPGKAQYVRWRAAVLQPEPLGSPDGVGPRDLLTAFGLGDEPPDKPAAKGPEKTRQPAANTSPPQSAAPMPAGLMDLLLQETPHWAGNINVLVGETDVERHRAQALRVYPGRLNMAWFIVGGGATNAYAFRLRGVGTDWDAKLFDMTSRETLVVNADDNGAIVPGEWIDTHGSRTMLLALRAPRKCEAATVAVRVIQKSTRREAVVEFSLDPRAAGRGCYAV